MKYLKLFALAATVALGSCSDDSVSEEKKVEDQKQTMLDDIQGEWIPYKITRESNVAGASPDRFAGECPNRDYMLEDEYRSYDEYVVASPFRYYFVLDASGQLIYDLDCEFDNPRESTWEFFKDGTGIVFEPNELSELVGSYRIVAYSKDELTLGEVLSTTNPLGLTITFRRPK